MEALSISSTTAERRRRPATDPRSESRSVLVPSREALRHARRSRGARSRAGRVHVPFVGVGGL